jgi:hypothetical protein
MTEILLKVALNIITITLAPNHVTLYGNFKVFITENKGKSTTVSCGVAQINNMIINKL